MADVKTYLVGSGDLCYEYWYDRHTRSWTGYMRDNHEMQHCNYAADYSHTKDGILGYAADAIAHEKQTRELRQANDDYEPTTLRHILTPRRER